LIEEVCFTEINIVGDNYTKAVAAVHSICF
jgi:hypothetical protein